MNTAVLRPIKWVEVYAMFGMKFEQDQFEVACLDVLPPSAWSIPVWQGISCDQLVVALKSLSIAVCGGIDGLDTAFQKPERERGSDSYIIGVNRSIDADPWSTNVSVELLLNGSSTFITPREWLWLALGCYKTFGLHLDKGSTTICPDYRLDDGSIVGLEYDAPMNMVIISNHSLMGESDPALRPRKVVAFCSQIPPAVFGI